MGRGGDSNKPKGRMSAYAYFVQTCREEHKKKHPNEQVVFAEFSKKCAERWKTMNDKEKQRFHQMAERDRKRYDGEMANYKPPKGEKRKKKKAKDPNAPKRALSAFFWFCNDERPKVKEAMPDTSVGEVAKELGRRWNAINPDLKTKYEALAAKDKARYEKEMKGYKAKTARGSPQKKGGGGRAAANGRQDDDSEDEEEEDEEDEDDDDDDDD